MYTISDEYKNAMNASIREASLMEITFHFASGDVIFTNDKIISFTETKSAGLIPSDIPTIDVSIELKNTDGLFNPNDTTNTPNYHDAIADGVEVTYKFGMPTVNGIEWVQGGYVYTDGDVTYGTTTAKITAYDNLSFLDSTVYYTFSGTQSLSTIAKNVIGLTDYLEDAEGNKKIKLGAELDAFMTPISIAPTSDKGLSPKQWLQHIAYAGCVKFYIDREGYLCLNNDTEIASYSQYELPLANQKEEPKHSKYQNPSKLTIQLDTDYGDDVEATLNGGGEELVITGNPYIVTTASGENLRDRLIDAFIPYRNEAQIDYRGEPALDVLDNITFDALFKTGLHGVITECSIKFNGTLEGSLTVRYFLSDIVSYGAGITGNTVFNFPYLSTIPIVQSLTLTCITDKIDPTFEWKYYLNGVWYSITGASLQTLTLNYDSAMFSNEDTLKVKCIVSGNKSATTTFTKNYYVPSSNSGYSGVIVGTTISDIASEITDPLIGDTILLNNTSDSGATYYGETYIYNGVEWVVTELSQYLMLAYKDALALEVATNIQIRTVSLISDLLYATIGFQENAPKGDSAYLHIKYSNDGGLTFTPNDGNDVGDYIGQYSDNIETDSILVGDYIWARFKGDAGTDGVDAISTQIYSTNGDKFRDGTANTTLQCFVFQGTENITDTIDEVHFNWTRKSALGTIEDNIWNTSSIARGHKTVLLTPIDVIGRSVFACEVEII